MRFLFAHESFKIFIFFYLVFLCAKDCCHKQKDTINRFLKFLEEEEHRLESFRKVQI